MTEQKGIVLYKLFIIIKFEFDDGKLEKFCDKYNKSICKFIYVQLNINWWT